MTKFPAGVFSAKGPACGELTLLQANAFAIFFYGIRLSCRCIHKRAPQCAGNVLVMCW